MDVNTQVRHGKHNGWPFGDLSSCNAQTWAATCHENETAPSCSLDKERDISYSSGSFLFLFFVCCFSFRTRRLSDHTPSAASLYGRLAACFSIQCTTGDIRIYWHCTRELQTFADLFFRIESKSQPHPSSSHQTATVD